MRNRKIDLYKKYPHDFQEKTLQYLLSKAKNTDFGILYNFNKLTSYNDFRDHLPIMSYDDLLPYVHKIRKGRRNVLWPGKVSFFAKSSGTTNQRSKYIPITKESLIDCHFKAGKDMLSLYCNNFIHNNIFNGKSLMLGGSISLNNKYKYIDGDLSAILIKNFPYWVSLHRSPDLKTSLLQDWDKKIIETCNQSIKENITSITGVPSWTLVLMNKILDVTGARNIQEVWPNLELYMHGGVNFEPYRSQFENLFPSNHMNYLQGYIASEGFFAIQDLKSSDDMLLMLDYGIFYEFIALDNFANESNDYLPLRDVELDEVYVIVISTNGGLWRYVIGDTIRFTCLDPYRIKVVGRTSSYINVFGEELMVENTDKALSECCIIHNCHVREYTVAPEYIDGSAGKHKWLIEFDIMPDDINNFRVDLDLELQKLNSDYAAKRSGNHVISELKLDVLASGHFYRWLKKYRNVGVQNKIPRLSNDDKIYNQILEI